MDKERFKVPKSVQQAIPIQRIWPDGIFQQGTKFSKTYRFTDINYYIASKDNKTEMFLDYSELLNSLDSGISAKITINNRRINKEEFEKSILLPMKEDGLDHYREEYNEMLLSKITGTNNSIYQERYLTVSVHKRSIDDARTYFARIGTDIVTHLAKLSSTAEGLDAESRLQIFRDFFKGDVPQAFPFDLKQFAKKGTSFKDWMCPDSMEFERDHFKIGDRYGRVLYMQDYASYVKDDMISELCDFSRNLMLSIDILPVPTDEAVRDDELNKMLEIGWRTARLCANETYMDCPYYEQLQYFGDTRIQAMITLYNTHDAYMVKNAIEQGRQSVVADGITMSRYPSSLHQFISSFSLWWICMGHDYWMYRGDEAYMTTLLPAYRGVLSWYEQWLKRDHSLGYVPHWFFADWAAGFQSGEPVREKDGNSAFQDLVYILTLESAAEMERAFGIPSIADHYTQIASAIRGTIREKYWDATRGLFADTYDHRSFSQHVNSLAILAGIVTGEEATRVMERTLNDSSLIQATIYFRYYVHQALKVAGMGDHLLDNLQIWRDQMALGLTTWAEMPEPTRSDCHAWGASPNIEFFRILLGIDSNAPGFKSIRIAPSLGDLKEVSGTMPHPVGSVTASYKLDKKGKLTARLILPTGTDGVFVWKGKEYQLKSGEQVLTVE